MERSRHELDLIWYYCDSAGALGLHGMTLEITSTETCPDDPGVSERQLKAATKHRLISSALHSLSHDEQKIIKLAFSTVEPWLRPLKAIAGDFVAIVANDVGSDEAKRLTELADKSGKEAKQAGKKLKALKEQAEERVKLAVKSFVRARGIVRKLEESARIAAYKRAICAA